MSDKGIYALSSLMMATSLFSLFVIASEPMDIYSWVAVCLSFPVILIWATIMYYTMSKS